MIFTNAFDRTIDAKSRIQVPTQVRDNMQSGQPSVLYLVPGSRQGTLSLFLTEQFESMAAHMDTQPIPDEDRLTYQQVFYSMACRLEMDKQGRVVLPDRLLRSAGIGPDVVLTGAGNHLDLWNKADYEAFISENLSQWQSVQRQARAASVKNTQSSAPGSNN